MGMLKRKKEEKAPSPGKLAEPLFFMEFGLDADVKSRIVADEKDGLLRRLNTITLVSPEMTDEQAAGLLKNLNGCLSEAGTLTVGFLASEVRREEGSDDD